MESTFADGTTDVASFSYANGDDPCQVTSISHTHASWPKQIDLSYDDCGRVTADSLGRRMTWDAQDRLTQVQYQGRTCDYGYDPSGNLSDRILDGSLTRSFFSAGQVTHEQSGDEVLQPISDGGGLIALNSITAGVRQRTTLLGCDAQGSVRLEADDSVRSRHYSTHGAEQEEAANGPYGYTGERREPLSGWYIPAGYRPYDPIIMGFISPDSESPFGRGGINPYAYCAGDPVNRIDPDGHAWWNWVIAGVELALGAVATVASFGAAAPVFAALAAGSISASGAMAMGAATLGAISLGTGVASTIVEAVGKDEKAAGILGWISLGTGLLGSALEIAPKAAARVATKLGRSPGRGYSKLSGVKVEMKAPGVARGRPGTGRVIRRVGESDIIYNVPNETHSVAFHRNAWRLDTAAFETHGHRGKLLNGRGRFQSATKVANREIAPRLNTLPNYVNDPERPLILLACRAARSGAAQKVSNALRRPVIAYGRELGTTTPEQLNAPLIFATTAESTTAPLELIRIPKIGPFTDSGAFRLGVPRIFMPQ
ncbi:tRNA nuclease WapA precursor [compost metagenome]